MNKIILKPASEKVDVRVPNTGEHLPKDGKEVTLNTYWQRRLNDGDVVEVKPRTNRKKSS